MTSAVRDDAPPATRQGGTLSASAAGLGDRVLTCAGPDDAVRWQQGERLERLFEQRSDEFSDARAVDAGPGARLSYAELDARANRLARFLAVGRAVRPGDRVGLLFDQAVDGYVGMLAVLKLHAVYVPLDAAFPPDRIAFIAADSEMRVLLSRSELTAGLADLGPGLDVVHLDRAEHEIAKLDGARLEPRERGEAPDDLCYVIYTSGTTGRPKGVAVSHASICNFVRVASEVYGIQRDDRVYQGLTIAFDFAVEEIWIAWMAGATLVPRPSLGNLLGVELADFLRKHSVTALCCVPTLLATLDDDLPDLRFLLVSGESCPQDLVDRWARPGRRLLNVYGPTEATVSATWTVLERGRPVTIGVPLPTYSVVILDPDENRALPLDQEGEIGIAGVGLADGYLNDPQRTESAFVPDFLPIPGNPSGRIYRTGDLGRVNAEGEIEYRGRIDTQVKIRGYRVEVAEIEAVLRQVPGVGRAVVSTHRPASGVEELVAYWVPAGDGEVDPERAHAALQRTLPAYMVPAYFEQLEELPLMPSGKVDRARLPAPVRSRRAGRSTDHVAPTSETEETLATTLAGILEVDRVSVADHFFDDLGASSLLMARFTAGLRGRSELSAVSIRDIYLHPSVRRLAAALGERLERPEGMTSTPVRELALPAPTGTPRYVLCGALQLLAFLVYACVTALALDALGSWLVGARGLLDLYARAVVVGGVTILGAGLLPIAAKWILIGRFKPQRIRVWSLAYVRFWIVKTLTVSNPVARLFVGTALSGLYLRALGARVGRGAVLLTTHVPVCTDVLTIGAGCVIRKEAYLNGYRARAGVIEIGPVEIGEGVVIGEQAVLDIATRLEDGAQLGHASGLLAGQVVPAGACWHGSPAEPAADGCNDRAVRPVACGSLRRAGYVALRTVALLTILAPLEAAVATVLLTHPPIADHLRLAFVPVAAMSLLLGLLLLALVVSWTVPRLLTRWLEPGRVYPLYGRHFALQRLIARTSSIGSLTALFGDSVAIVGYLRVLGYRLGVIEQTGSNFGMEVRHEVPALCHIGRGTMVSDGLSMLNAEFSSSSFRVRPVTIGERSFLGNALAYPAGARVGNDCLLATKVMVPIDGPTREGVGLLGSPAFEIPRSTGSAAEVGGLAAGPERDRRLAAKTRHNLVTMAWRLIARTLFLTVLMLVALAPIQGGTGWAGMARTALSTVLDVAVIPVAIFVLVERLVTRFRPLEPKVRSIYHRDFWCHERLWKVPALVYLRVFDGTPLKGLVWRLLGVRVGRRLFDDGATLVERSLVGLGGDVTLNMGSILHCHSLEDGMFKSDRVRIGNRCTVGTYGLVHYGVVMEDGSSVEADSFVMKGSQLAAGEIWNGNPAARS